MQHPSAGGMSPGGGATTGGNSMTPGQKLVLKYSRIYQTQLDRTVIYPQARWAFFFFVLFVYCIRVYYLQGFYIVSYAMGIYLLNLVIGFLSPAIDPDDEGFDNDDSPMLPTAYDLGQSTSAEYKPFNRKLPEFKFWHAATKSTLIFLTMTFFSIFDLPVFWPILLAYFILLVFITGKERIKHMLKYKYVPFSWGKTTYRDLTRTSVSNPAALGKAGGAPIDPKRAS